MSRTIENNGNKDLIAAIVFGILTVASICAKLYLSLLARKLEQKLETLRSAVHVALDSNGLNIREALEVLHRNN